VQSSTSSNESADARKIEPCAEAVKTTIIKSAIADRTMGFARSTSSCLFRMLKAAGYTKKAGGSQVQTETSQPTIPLDFGFRRAS
jgi:hypothetical protein